MTPRTVVALAAVLSALAGAGAAQAVSVPAKLVLTTSQAKQDASRSCTAKRQGHAGSSSPDRKAAPVACEQPPRSEQIPSSALLKSLGSALATVG